MVKRPAFQFYPGDWTQNPNLRRCTHEEKGAWIDVMCLMHDQEEYGVLRWPLKEIAQATGARMSVLQALVNKSVLKGADPKHTSPAFIFTPRHAGKDGDPVTLVVEQTGPIWFSSRMVRDEYVRTKRGIGTRFGEEPKPPLGEPPKVPIGDGASTPPPSSTSTSTPGGIPPPSTTDGEGNPLPPLPDEPTSIADLSNYLTRRGMTPRALVTQASRALLNRWVSEGITWEQLDTAFAEAERTLKGDPPGTPTYLDTILKRLSTQQTRRSIHDERAATIAAATGANRQRPAERDITPDSAVVG